MTYDDEVAMAKAEWRKCGMTARMWRDSVHAVEQVYISCGLATANDVRRVADKYGRRAK